MAVARLARKVWPLGDDPMHAHIAKIAGNGMITQAIASMAEATALVRSHGLGAAPFLDVLTQTVFACPSDQRYASHIAQDRYEPGFKLPLGLKDVRLALDAARAGGVRLPQAALVEGYMQQALDEGGAELDWSVLARAALHALSVGPLGTE